MLNARLLSIAVLLAAPALPAAAQDMAPHRAVYSVVTLDHGKPGDGVPGTCDGYIVNQRLRLELPGPRGMVVSEQMSQMTESRDGKKLRFEHRSTTDGRETSLIKGDALLGDDGSGQAHFSDPEGQTVALPVGTLFPVAIARETIRQAKAGEGGFDALFFYGEKVKAPQSVNIVIGKVPKRLATVKIPEGAEQLADGRSRIYYRAGFFEALSKGQVQAQGEPAFEMSSITLDNGIELYGTHEESDAGIEYSITRLEPLPKPECK
jgi:EipB-like